MPFVPGSFIQPSTPPPPQQKSGGGFSPWGALGGLFGIGSDILNRHYRKKEERGRRKYEQARELDRRAYDQAMWNKVNQYNHPLQQMARLSEAGLNPNLIYGSSPGSAVGNAQSIAPGKQLQAQAPQYQFNNPITPFMDTRVKQAQTNNLKADVLLKATQGMKNTADAGLTGSKKSLLDAQADDLISKTSSDASIAKLDALIKGKTSEAVIKQAMTKLDGMVLSNKLQQAALDWAQAGYSGSVVTQMAMALGDDLRTEEGRRSFKTKANIALGLKGAEAVSNTVRNLISPFSGLFSNIGKKPPNYTFNRYFWQR
jgi:hypothetical protein